MVLHTASLLCLLMPLRTGVLAAQKLNSSRPGGEIWLTQTNRKFFSRDGEKGFCRRHIEVGEQGVTGRARFGRCVLFNSQDDSR